VEGLVEEVVAWKSVEGLVAAVVAVVLVAEEVAGAGKMGSSKLCMGKGRICST
jgi:hypothetical protein